MKPLSALIAVLVLLGACRAGDSAVSPQPGTLTLTLTGGGSTDGAIVLTISGGAVTSVAGAAGYEVASNADVTGTHLMVVGNIANGKLATIEVPDISLAAGYVVSVSQVADRSSFALLDPGHYAVSIAR